MKLIIGLGNPGVKYLKNRHNVGHMFIDFVNKNSQILNTKYQILKTSCYMNQSGGFVQSTLNSRGLSPSEIVVVHDDLDIPFGKFKLQFATGPKIHNGIISIEQTLDTNEFWRLRIGIDNRPSSAKASEGETYVLQDFTSEEKEAVKNVFIEAVKQLTINN